VIALIVVVICFYCWKQLRNLLLLLHRLGYFGSNNSNRLAKMPRRRPKENYGSSGMKHYRRVINEDRSLSKQFEREECDLREQLRLKEDQRLNTEEDGPPSPDLDADTPPVSDYDSCSTVTSSQALDDFWMAI
jgi:hypothetical protein